jgi:hypothetical protein
MSHHPIPVADQVVPAWAVILGVTILSATTGRAPLRLARAPRWSLILTNSTGGAITALRLRFRNRSDGAWGPWESVTSGLPLADGAALRVSDAYGANACEQLDVEVTAASAGPVALDLVGV